MGRQCSDPGFWRRADVSAALAGRDAGALFGLFRSLGVPDFVAGQRVVSLDLVDRIADGLRIPQNLRFDHGPVITRSGRSCPTRLGDGDA
jgi:hypothetical protein